MIGIYATKIKDFTTLLGSGYHSDNESAWQDLINFVSLEICIVLYEQAVIYIKLLI